MATIPSTMTVRACENPASRRLSRIAFSELNSNFGTREDLQTLSSALHARGMYLMVDVVVNHVGSPRNQVFHPDDRYGLLNQPEDYHPHCWIRNYDNQTEVEQCWIGEDQREALVDVNTESPKVVREMYRWIRQLVADYDIDGLRVDTVKHGQPMLRLRYLPKANETLYLCTCSA
jgi:alpha-amylase